MRIDAAAAAVRWEISRAVRRRIREDENDADIAADDSADDSADDDGGLGLQSPPPPSSSLFRDEVRDQEMRYLDRILPAAVGADGATADPVRRLGRHAPARSSTRGDVVHRKFFASKRRDSASSSSSSRGGGAVAARILRRLGRRCARGLAAAGAAIERILARAAADARRRSILPPPGDGGGAAALPNDAAASMRDDADGNERVGTANDDDGKAGAGRGEEDAHPRRSPVPPLPSKEAFFPAMMATPSSWMILRGGATDRACSRALAMVRNRILDHRRRNR